MTIEKTNSEKQMINYILVTLSLGMVAVISALMHLAH